MKTFSDAEMDAGINRWRKIPNVEQLYIEFANPEFLAVLEAAYARGQKEPSKDFLFFDAEGWYPGQFCVAQEQIAPSCLPPKPVIPQRSKTELEIRQETAKFLAELAALETECESTYIPVHGCTAGERIAKLRAFLPPPTEIPTASPAMAPANIPAVWKPYEHSGIARYSDETHVGRIEAASGKGEHNFRIDPASLKKPTPQDQ
jgi:hypothetical protein